MFYFELFTPVSLATDYSKHLAFDYDDRLCTTAQNIVQLSFHTPLISTFGMKCINTVRLYLSPGGKDPKLKPGYMLLNTGTPYFIRKQLIQMGYTLSSDERAFGAISAIYLNRKHGSLLAAPVIMEKILKLYGSIKLSLMRSVNQI